jgi:hypothetical protein
VGTTDTGETALTVGAALPSCIGHPVGAQAARPTMTIKIIKTG